MNIHANLILAFTALTSLGFAAPKERPMQNTKPTILLVHGAFADASGWGRVITLLEKDGYPVATVQNPLSGLPDDVATTKRAIHSIEGPIVLVGHSYGGAVISGAGTGESNVKSLVFVAAFAPEAGEKLGDFMGKFGVPDLATALVPDKGGYLSIDRAKFHAVFCADLGEHEAHLMSVTQKPINSAAFADIPGEPAWKTVPSWYMVASEDHAIKPELERYMAKRMNAHTSEIKSSHVAFMSHAEEVVKMIEEASN
jgi:pimeloyl-ACP methyl ester carboxylesterase